MDSILATAAFELSPDKHPGAYSYTYQYYKNRYAEIRQRFQRSKDLDPTQRRKEAAKGLGLSALLAVQYSPADEMMLGAVGVQTLAATGKPWAAAAAVGAANFAEHYAAGKIVANLKTLDNELVEKSPVDDSIDGTKKFGRYVRSLLFGTGVDMVWQKANYIEPEPTYPAKSAGVIAALNTTMAAGIAYGVEAAGAVEQVRDNLPALALGIGYLAISSQVAGEAWSKYQSKKTEGPSTSE